MSSSSSDEDEFCLRRDRFDYSSVWPSQNLLPAVKISRIVDSLTEVKMKDGNDTAVKRFASYDESMSVSDDYRPPSYRSSYSQTDVKRFISHNRETGAAEAGIDIGDSFSNILTSPDRASLNVAVELLKQEQEEIKKLQLKHEQHLKQLLDSQPLLQKHLECVHKTPNNDQVTTVQPYVPPVPQKIVMKTNRYDPLDALFEERFYVQFEQLYVNAKIFKTTPIGQNSNGFYDDALRSEISSLKEANKKLKEKVAELEKKHTQDIHNRIGLHVPEFSFHFGTGMKASKSLTKLDDSGIGRNTNYSVNTTAIAGRPTSPVPPPLLIQDIRPTEMTFKWTIGDYCKKWREERRTGSKETSCPFYLSHCGYKVQMEAYLNGNGTAKNRCISVFLRIIKGEYDRYLKWPVNLHVVVILVNQSENRADSLKASGNMFQYQQPFGTSEAESDSWGLVEFVRHDVIKTKQYIRDDKILLKCSVTILAS
ncbi:hypothetical protein Btru_075191 [Bulinus truncatus]|nr:hypothetical protein Btru_075191 [Bulinus truncatus]